MTTLWKNPVDLQFLNQKNDQTIHGALGIVITQIGPDYLEGTMPVDQRTHQPAGLLHGGASAVLAESLGSIASLLVVGIGEKTCVGTELNLSHLRGIRSGEVTGRVTPIRVGQSIHVWEIKIWDSADVDHKLICIARLSVMTRGRRPSPDSSK